jgi:hypothetical protein
MAAKLKGEQMPLLEEEEPAGEEAAGYQKRSTPLEIKGLPDGVKAILRLKPWRDAKEYSAYIYRRIPDETRPGRIAKKFCRRVYNIEIEESWLQTNFPRGGKFSIIYQIPHPDKPGDVQIHSDDFDIEPVETAGALVAPGAVLSPAGAQASAGDLRSSIGNLRELAEVLVMLKGDSPIGGAPPAAPAWLEKMYQDKLKRLEELEEKLQRKITGQGMLITQGKPPAAEDDKDSFWPEFLRPYVPGIKKFGISTMESLASKLLGGGLESAGLRFLVLNNPEFQALWADEARRNEAAQTIISALGHAGENLVGLFAQEMAKKAGG